MTRLFHLRELEELSGVKGSYRELEADSIAIHQQDYRPLTPKPEGR